MAANQIALSTTELFRFLKFDVSPTHQNIPLSRLGFYFESQTQEVFELVFSVKWGFYFESNFYA